MADFHGFPTRRVSSSALEVDYLTTAGPRLVRLSYKGSANLLAEVPEITVPTPFGDFRYLGGHRLWHAPESMPGSYIPDNDDLSVSETPGGLILDGKTERLTRIHKRIQVQLDARRPHIELVHTLVNESTSEVELSPWALTMFRLGGIAILPIRTGQWSDEDLLPDRHLTLWPYSRIRDPRLHLQDDFVLVEAMPDLPPLKIGSLTPLGWTAYLLEGVLFRKSFETRSGLPHPDHGCNAEIYCDSHFIELESLGPLARLAPGASISLTESWDLYDSLEQDWLPTEIRQELNQKARR